VPITAGRTAEKCKAETESKEFFAWNELGLVKATM
jgi:hypothetical protein